MVALIVQSAVQIPGDGRASAAPLPAPPVLLPVASSDGVPTAAEQKVKRAVETAVSLRVVPNDLRPRLSEAANDRSQGCIDQIDATAPSMSCVLGDTSSGQTVVLFGDSHATQWRPALEQIAASRRWKLVPVVKGGCPVADFIQVFPPLRRRYTECEQWRTLAKLLSRSGPNGLAFIRGRL